MQMMRCGFSALPGHYVVFFGNGFTLTVPQFIHVYKWVSAVRRLLSLSSLHVSSTILFQHYQISRATAPFAVLFSVHISTIDVSFFDIGKNLSKLVNAIYSAVCEESIGGFEPIRNLTEKDFE